MATLVIFNFNQYQLSDDQVISVEQLTQLEVHDIIDINFLPDYDQYAKTLPDQVDQAFKREYLFSGYLMFNPFLVILPEDPCSSALIVQKFHEMTDKFPAILQMKNGRMIHDIIDNGNGLIPEEDQPDNANDII